MRLTVALAGLLIAMTLAGCTSPAERPDEEYMARLTVGSVSIYLKDAPGDLQELHLNITSVQVHLVGNATATSGNATGNATDDAAGNATAPSDATPGCSGWTEVADLSVSLDLMAASGPLAAFLGELDLPACKVTQIRLMVSVAYGVQDNQTVPVTLANDTLKVVRSFDVQPGEIRVVIDVDLDSSLHHTGQGWKLTPKIGKTTVEVVDDASSGAEVSEPGDLAAVA